MENLSQFEFNEFLDKLDDKTLLALAQTNKQYRLPILRKMVLRKFGQDFLDRKGEMSESEWYSALIYTDVTIEGLKKLIAKGYIEMVDLYSRLDPNLDLSFHPYLINIAAAANQARMFNWLQSRGLIPYFDAVNEAIKNGSLDILDLLDYFSTSDANYAASYGQNQVLDYFKKKKIYPDMNGASDAAINGHLETVKWLQKEGIYPSHFSLNYVAKNGHLDILKFVHGKRKDMLPDIRGLMLAKVNNQEEVVAWLNEEGIK